jgi:hypothetical protein
MLRAAAGRRNRLLPAPSHPGHREDADLEWLSWPGWTVTVAFGTRTLEDPRFGLVTADGLGVHDDVDAQAVVVQASHQVVVIGVGDYSDADGHAYDEGMGCFAAMTTRTAA